MIEQIVYAMPFLLDGLWTTVVVSVLTVAISLVLGVILGCGLVSGRPWWR
jgi:polar amino acid transport system permease protein